MVHRTKVPGPERVIHRFAGVLSAKLLRKSQRISIFLIFLFAAVATPSTDPFTMCAMALPMVLLFEGAVLFAVIHDRRKARRRAAEREVTHLDDDMPSSVDAHRVHGPGGCRAA